MGQHDETADDSRSRAVLPKRTGSTITSELSEGERALIYRRRMGISQKNMASSFGLSRRAYSEKEVDDTLTLPDSFRIVVFASELTPGEKCLLWRRRSGWTQQECADLMGITRYWYNLMENSKVSADKLEAFWNEG